MLSKIIRILVLAGLISAPAYALAFDPNIECDLGKTINVNILGSDAEMQSLFAAENIEDNAKCDDSKCVICFSDDDNDVDVYLWKSSAPLMLNNNSSRQLIIYNLKLNTEIAPAPVSIKVIGKNVSLEGGSVVGSPQQVGVELTGSGHKVSNCKIGMADKLYKKGLALGVGRVSAENFVLENTIVHANENIVSMANLNGFDLVGGIALPLNLNNAITSTSPVVVEKEKFGVLCAKPADGKLDDAVIKFCPKDEDGVNKFNVLAGVLPAGVTNGYVRVFNVVDNYIVGEERACPVSPLIEPLNITASVAVNVIEPCADCYKFECPEDAEYSFLETGKFVMIFDGDDRDEAVVTSQGSNVFILTAKGVISVIGAQTIPGTVSDATGGSDGFAGAIPLIIDSGTSQPKAQGASGGGQQVSQGSGGGCGGQQSLSGGKMPSAAATIVGLLFIGGLPALIPARMRARHKHK